MYGVAKTPDACHLFNVNDGGKKLPEDKAQLFHYIMLASPLPHKFLRCLI